jgi:hypothetical protein
VARDKCSKRVGSHLADYDHGRDDQDRSCIFREKGGIDEKTHGNEKDGAKHVADWFHEHFDPGDLPRFGHDGADQERSERDAVTELHSEKRNAETETQDGDKQHFVALESRHVIQEARHDDQTGDEQNAQERAELEQRPANRGRGEGTGGREAGKERDHHDGKDVFDDQNAEHELGKTFLLEP